MRLCLYMRAQGPNAQCMDYHDLSSSLSQISTLFEFSAHAKIRTQDPRPQSFFFITRHLGLVNICDYNHMKIMYLTNYFYEAPRWNSNLGPKAFSLLEFEIAH